MYKRPGRRIWYCSFSDAEKHISLETEDDERARERFAELVAERGSVPLEADETSLTDLWQRTREHANTNNTDKTAYELHLNLRRIVTWCEAHGVRNSRAVEKQTIEDYKTSRRFDGVTAARINRELDSWRRMMKLGVERGMVHKSVPDMFEKLREPRPEPHRKTLTRAQLRRVLARVRVKGYRALYRAALGCGLRDEELRHVETEDVRRREVAVTPKPNWTTKSYHYRVIPITATTRVALLDWIAARDGGKLNTDKKRIWKVLQRACKLAKAPATSLHELRRACASHWYESGVPIKTISLWLGHREVATTERYLRVVTPHVPAGVKLPW